MVEFVTKKPELQAYAWKLAPMYKWSKDNNFKIRQGKLRFL